VDNNEAPRGTIGAPIRSFTRAPRLRELLSRDRLAIFHGLKKPLRHKRFSTRQDNRDTRARGVSAAQMHGAMLR
jgi:hypothetical protein